MAGKWQPRSVSGNDASSPGNRVSARVENGELRVISSTVAVQQVQARMLRYKKPGESVVDEFLAERRRLWGED